MTALALGAMTLVVLAALHVAITGAFNEVRMRRQLAEQAEDHRWERRHVSQRNKFRWVRR